MKRTTLSLCTAALLLAACGGGVWIGVGDDDWDDRAPSVSIAAAQSSVRAGSTVRVIAAASDEDGIVFVTLYRLEPGSAGGVLVERDGSSPYEWIAAAPTDGRTSLQLFARATDGSGRSADSATLSIPITP